MGISDLFVGKLTESQVDENVACYINKGHCSRQPSAPPPPLPNVSQRELRMETSRLLADRSSASIATPRGDSGWEAQDTGPRQLRCTAKE